MGCGGHRATDVKILSEGENAQVIGVLLLDVSSVLQPTYHVVSMRTMPDAVFGERRFRALPLRRGRVH
jgi:hypothetical protein